MSRRGAPSADVAENRRLVAGFVCLVGASGGLMAVYGGAPIAAILAATVGGLLVGGGLLWYVQQLAR